GEAVLGSYSRTMTISVSDGVPPAAMPSGAVGSWNGDGNTSDSSGNGNNGSTSGTVLYAPGVFGQAFQFNGNSSVVIPNSASLNPTAAISVEAWVYTSNPRQPADLVTKDGENVDRQFILNLQSTGRFRAHIGVAGALRFFDGATTIAANTWYHVVM